MNVQDEVAKILLDIKAITFNAKKPYKYNTGILSPVYTDCRLLISHPKERKKIINFYTDSIQKLDDSINHIAGTATAGIPHAAWIAASLNLPMVYVRNKPKDYGKGNQIEGLVNNSHHSIVIEDHMSTAKSSLESALALRATGAKVNYIHTITSYGLKVAKDKLKENKLKHISLTNLQAVVNIASKLSYIKPSEKKLILTWAEDPENWGRKMGFE